MHFIGRFVRTNQIIDEYKKGLHQGSDIVGLHYTENHITFNDFCSVPQAMVTKHIKINFEILNAPFYFVTRDLLVI